MALRYVNCHMLPARAPAVGTGDVWPATAGARQEESSAATRSSVEIRMQENSVGARSRATVVISAAFDVESRKDADAMRDSR
jgi:hypothetical protein